MIFRVSVFLLFLPLGLFAQRSAEIGLTGGVSWYNGELNPARQFYELNPAGGILFRHNFNYRFSFRATALRMLLTGNDLTSGNGFQAQRGLSFTNSLNEFSGIIEFNFLPYEVGEGRYPFTTYVFGGVGVFKMNPRSGGQLLSEVATEPDKKYSLTQPAIPFGFGIKASLFGRLGIFAEWGMRKTFTDYLDDVSTVWHPAASASLQGMQRGNSRNKDWYSYAGAGLVYVFRKKIPCPAYNRGN